MSKASWSPNSFLSAPFQLFPDFNSSTPTAPHQRRAWRGVVAIRDNICYTLRATRIRAESFIGLVAFSFQTNHFALELETSYRSPTPFTQKHLFIRIYPYNGLIFYCATF